jgi:CRP/FNR family transcriptional regulator
MQILPISSSVKISALRQNSYFSGLSEQSLTTLIQGMQLFSYAPGEVICWQGEECSGFYMIRKGNVKLFKISPRGREFIIRVLVEGSSFNEVPVFDQGINPVNVGALEMSEVLLVTKDEIQRVLQNDPSAARYFIENLCGNLCNLISKVEELSFHQVTNRLARLIVQMPEEQLLGLSTPRITQDQMAARLGTVREVVARSLRELERSGAIRVNRRHIEVLNTHILHAWAQDPN